MSDGSLEELREQLAAIIERIDDLAMDALRSAIAAGERTRPELERRLTRARNALERAMRLLSSD